MRPDVNVLVAAHHGDHSHHAVAASWLNGVLDDAAQRPVSPMRAVGSFLRQVTRHGGASEWPAFRRLMLERKLAANEVPDAWLAAFSLASSEPFVTFDKGFRKLLPRSLLVLLQPA